MNRGSKTLSTVNSKVCLVIDCWTSSNQISFLGVVARFIDNDWKHKTFALDLIELLGPKSGENIANALIPVLEEFKILDKLGSITTDNESAMDTVFDCFSDLVTEKGYFFDKNHQRRKMHGTHN